MNRIYLPSNASRARLRDAERARRNRVEIVRELSWGTVSRRDLTKWGLFTGAGVLAPIGGLNPFVKSMSAAAGPTGAPPSPLFGAAAFTQPMPRFDVLARKSVSTLSPQPTAESNQTLQAVDSLLGGGMGPVEGRPPGPVWGHQKFAEYYPAIAMESTTTGVHANKSYAPQVTNALNSGIDKTLDCEARFHPKMAIQARNSMWTFDGSFPPKLVIGRYGEPILFRHHNRLPADVTQNRGFGRHTHLDPRAQRPPRRRERRLHRRVLLPGPVLRLPLADRARRASTPSTRGATDPQACDARRQRRARPTSRATGTRR